jgi:hypothetical protein
MQLHVEAVDGSYTAPVALMSTLYRYVVMARVCETSSTDIWSVRAPMGAGRRLAQMAPLLRLATEKVIGTLAMGDLTMPSTSQGSVFTRRAMELLPMLSKQFKYAASTSAYSCDVLLAFVVLVQKDMTKFT